MRKVKIFSAPLQGITDARFRLQHHRLYGGIDCYYTPFVRLVQGGLRDKDRRDILPERNRDVPTVPQVIAKDRDEFAHLCDLLQHLGWNRIDLNMGCPFPMQYHSGRGSGLLPKPDCVAKILEEMKRRPEVSFSVKMRLGLTNKSDCLLLLPLLNESPLTLVTMHPRLGVQQYRETTDMESFEAFYKGCTRPLVYNGDIKSIGDISLTIKQFPLLEAIMIGRGLIEHPQLGKEWVDCS